MWRVRDSPLPRAIVILKSEESCLLHCKDPSLYGLLLFILIAVRQKVLKDNISHSLPRHFPIALVCSKRTMDEERLLVNTHAWHFPAVQFPALWGLARTNTIGKSKANRI